MHRQNSHLALSFSLLCPCYSMLVATNSEIFLSPVAHSSSTLTDTSKDYRYKHTDDGGLFPDPLSFYCRHSDSLVDRVFCFCFCLRAGSNYISDERREGDEFMEQGSRKRTREEVCASMVSIALLQRCSLILSLLLGMLTAKHNFIPPYRTASRILKCIALPSNEVSIPWRPHPNARFITHSLRCTHRYIHRRRSSQIDDADLLLIMKINLRLRSRFHKEFYLHGRCWRVECTQLLKYVVHLSVSLRGDVNQCVVMLNRHNC